MTLQEAAKAAIECQNAVNLSGVAFTFANDVCPALWAEARKRDEGSEFVNKHPIVTLFLGKLADLNGKWFEHEYNEDYMKVKEIAGCL